MRNGKTANVPDKGDPSERTLRGKLEVHGSARSKGNEKKYENSAIHIGEWDYGIMSSNVPLLVFHDSQQDSTRLSQHQKSIDG